MKPSEQYSLLGNSRYPLAVIVFIFFLYCTLINRKNHIYGMIYPVLIASPILDPSNYFLFALIILVFLYRWFDDEQSENRNFTNAHVVVVLFYLFEEIKQDLQYVEFCLLFFFVAVCLVHLFWKPIRVKITSDKKNVARNVTLSDKKKMLNEYYEYIRDKKETAMKI